MLATPTTAVFPICQAAACCMVTINNTIDIPKAINIPPDAFMNLLAKGFISFGIKAIKYVPAKSMRTADMP
jgi:hypothetical protein